MITTSGATITKAASKQTYYTVRFLVDRERVEDAYRAYGYFRWVDDTLDAASGSNSERLAFLERQETLLEGCLRNELPNVVNEQEKMLVELIQHDHDRNSGLQIYLRNMMQVMEFDARRRGQLVSQAELNEYTHWLATAVMEAIHNFIGHDESAPHDERRYLAVSAAHITHMLRDTYDDLQAGYYNIPSEVLEANHIGPRDVQSDAYRAWVRGRVKLAREYFEAGRGYFAQVENRRCRLACFAYIARFDWLLDTIEKEGFCLRPQYNERKSTPTAVRMSWLTLKSAIGSKDVSTPQRPAATRPISKT